MNRNLTDVPYHLFRFKLTLSSLKIKNLSFTELQKSFLHIENKLKQMTENKCSKSVDNI